jgi:hypothetical protein
MLSFNVEIFPFEAKPRMRNEALKDNINSRHQNLVWQNIRLILSRGVNTAFSAS